MRLFALLALVLKVSADTDCQCVDQMGFTVFHWQCSDWLMNQDCGPDGCNDNNFCTPTCNPNLNQCHGGLTTSGIIAIVGISLCVLSTCIRVVRRSNRVRPAPAAVVPAAQPRAQNQPRAQGRQRHQQPLLSPATDAPPSYDSISPAPAGAPQLVAVLAPSGAAPPAIAHPIHVAANHGDEAKCAQLLAEGTYVDLVSPAGYTPLLLAASGGHEGCVRLMLQYRANVHQTTPQGHTALHLAALKGHTKVCIALINGGASLQARTHKSSTPLGLAVFGKHDDTAQYLRSVGAL